jgi:hypothetical protein
MFRKQSIFVLGLVLVWGVSPSAYAGTMILDSFVDQTTDPIDQTIGSQLIATVNTSGTQGGNDASASWPTLL